MQVAREIFLNLPPLPEGLDLVQKGPQKNLTKFLKSWGIERVWEEGEVRDDDEDDDDDDDGGNVEEEDDDEFENDIYGENEENDDVSENYEEGESFDNGLEVDSEIEAHIRSL